MNTRGARDEWPTPPEERDAPMAVTPARAELRPQVRDADASCRGNQRRACPDPAPASGRGTAGERIDDGGLDAHDGRLDDGRRGALLGSVDRDHGPYHPLAHQTAPEIASPEVPLMRAAKCRLAPFARRPSNSMRKPARSTAASVSRLGWHPPAAQVHSGWMTSWNRARHGTRERTCSSMRSWPSGRSTRFTSASPRAGSPTLQNTRPLSTVSKLPSRNG